MVAIVKSGSEFTIRETVAEWVSEPPIPVIVSIDVPDGVFAAVVTSKVADPVPEMVDGVNDAVAFVGSPLALRLTVPANPFAAPMVTV